MYEKELGFFMTNWTMLQELAAFVACPCELGQMADHPQTFSSTGKCRRTHQARPDMRGPLLPEYKKTLFGSLQSPFQIN